MGLLVAIAATAAFVGWLIAGLTGVLVTLALAIGIGWLAPPPPTELALREQGARRLRAPWLERAVAELARRADLERPPALIALPSRAPQAFAAEGASGAAIGVTASLLDRLHSREVVAVVAHEIAHLRAGDLGLMRFVAVVSGLTRATSHIGLLLVLFNVPLAFFTGYAIPWLSLLVLVAAPWLIHMMSLALSRAREHDADVGAVELTGDPRARASALAKIEAAHLGPWWTALFRRATPERWQTHPSTNERVARLREMAGADPLNA